MATGSTGPICPCVNEGLTVFENILKKGLMDVFGTNFNVLLQLWNTFKCNLPKDVEERVSSYIARIQNESSSAVTTVNLLYVIIIFGTLFFLFLLNYIAIYAANSSYTIAIGIFSLIIIIVAAVILLLMTSNTYSTSATNVTTYLTQIQNIVFQIKDAGELGLCCLGGCSQCICPVVFPAVPCPICPLQPINI